MKLGSLSGFLLMRVPYYIGDLQRDPDLENYPMLYISTTCSKDAKDGPPHRNPSATSRAEGRLTSQVSDRPPPKPKTPNPKPETPKP